MTEPLFELDVNDADQVVALVALMQRSQWVEGGQVTRWPADDTLDRILVTQLLETYPTLNIAEEFQKWTGAMLDYKSRKKVKPRARFKNWCVNADTYARRDGRRVNRPSGGLATSRRGGSQPRPGGTPVGPDAVTESGWTRFD